MTVAIFLLFIFALLIFVSWKLFGRPFYEKIEGLKEEIKSEEPIEELKKSQKPRMKSAKKKKTKKKSSKKKKS